MRELYVCELGARAYAEVLELQRAVARARISGAIDQDVLILVEHPPVVTLGRSSKANHLLASPALLAARGVELFEVERGGDVTFHGPGQLVGYPIFDLKHHKQDLHWYLRQVEEALIRGVAPFRITGERNVGYTGVWTQGRKLASIGVHARDWVTWHGFALNVTTDLSYFDLMVPCGIAEVQMTSIAGELARRVPPEGSIAEEPDAETLWQQTTRNVSAAFAELFGLDEVALDPDALQRVASVATAG